MLHASGFTNEGRSPDATSERRGRDIPMRVLRVLDKLKTAKTVNNFVPIVFEVVAIIRVEHPIASRWGQAVIANEVLEHIDEMNSLSPLFDSTIEYVLSTYDKNRVCECNLS